jgi:hypothetical protein
MRDLRIKLLGRLISDTDGATEGGIKMNNIEFAGSFVMYITSYDQMTSQRDRLQQQLAPNETKISLLDEAPTSSELVNDEHRLEEMWIVRPAKAEV